MNLGENIYRFRTQRSMSQDDLAAELGVSRQSISKWENNNSVPDLDKLLKIAELFGITLDELVSGKASSPSDKPAPANAPRSFPRRQNVGIVLFCIAAFLFLYCALDRQAASGLLYAFPFVLCGIWCFTKLRHVWLWCAWTFCLPLVFIPFISYFRFDIAIFAGLLLYLPIFSATVWCLRNDPAPRGKITAIFLISGYLLCFAWLINYIFGFIEFSAYYGTVVHWINAAMFLLFTSVVSISLRLLKKQ